MEAMDAKRQRNLHLALLILRISTGLFFLAWSLDKIFVPGHTVKVFGKFYFLQITPEIAIGLGMVQTLIVILFMLGLYKKWTTGALLAMHTFSVLSTWEKLIFAFSAKGLLFWAAVPVWAGLFLLWLMRNEDVLYSLHPKNE